MIPQIPGSRAEPFLVCPDARRADINLARLQQLGMVTHEGGRTGVAEDFRIIKRPLLRGARGLDSQPIQHGNLIIVTSALPGEGKTYCAINLAMSMAMERDTHGPARGRRCRPPRGAQCARSGAGPRPDGRVARR